MAHQNFLRGLTKDERRAMTQKTNIHALLRVFVLTLLIATLSVGIVSRIPFWFLLLPISGLLLVSLFHFLHECIHDTPFQSKALNRIAGTVCGFLLFLPSEWFRYFHRDHHRYTQVEGRDPELDSAKPATKIQWLVHLTGFSVYRSSILVFRQYIQNTEVEAFIPPRARIEVVNEIRAMSLGYALLLLVSITLGSTALLWIWIIPLLLGQPFLRLYLLAEHTLCDHSEDMFRNTRTVLSNPVVRWFTWNMPFHTEHHVYPGVPFHQLPVLHRKIQNYLVHTETSYVDFNQQLYNKMS